MKDMIIKGLILVGVVLYFISPIDFVPGVLVDDAIVVLLGILKSRKISAKQAA